MTSIEYLFNELWETPKDKLTWHSVLNKAKEMHKQEIETLYTEEQVREVIKNCFKSNSLGFLITEDDMMRTIKQPKKY
jgi:hypothetical protein